MSSTVLVTDYAWPSHDIERGILAKADAKLLVTETGCEDEIISMAPEADAILTNWKRVPAAALEAAPRYCIIANDFQRVLAESDYVSLHTPATPETHRLIGEKELRAMRPTAYLVNTSVARSSMRTFLRVLCERRLDRRRSPRRAGAGAFPSGLRSGAAGSG